MKERYKIIVPVSIFLVFVTSMILLRGNYLLVIDPLFPYEQSYSYNGINIISRSEYIFGEQTYTPMTGSNWVNISTINNAESLSIRLSTSKAQSSDRFSIGEKPPIFTTYSKTENLNINTDNLTSLFFNVYTEKSISCTGNSLGMMDFTHYSSVYLVSPTDEILLWKANSDDSSAVVRLSKTDNQFILSVNGNNNIFALPSGIYELALYAPLTPNNFAICDDTGASATQEITLNSLNITNSEAGCTQEVAYCPDGSFVSRDPDNNCEFKKCPVQPDPYKWLVIAIILLAIGLLITIAYIIGRKK